LVRGGIMRYIALIYLCMLFGAYAAVDTMDGVPITTGYTFDGATGIGEILGQTVKSGSPTAYTPPQTNSIMGWWGHEQTEGDASIGHYTDFSGNDNHGTNTASLRPAYTNAGPGCFVVDGIDDFVDLSAVVSLYKGYNYGTVSGWFKNVDADQSGTTAGRMMACSKGSATSSDRHGYNLGSQTGNFGDESTGWVVVRGGSVTINGPYVRLGHAYLFDGAWHHIVVSINTTNNLNLVDGTEYAGSYVTQGSTTHEFFNLPLADLLAIAASKYNGAVTPHGVKSIFADVMIWTNVGLTSAESKTLYDQQKGDYGL